MIHRFTKPNKINHLMSCSTNSANLSEHFSECAKAARSMCPYNKSLKYILREVCIKKFLVRRSKLIVNFINRLQNNVSLEKQRCTEIYKISPSNIGNFSIITAFTSRNLILTISTTPSSLS